MTSARDIVTKHVDAMKADADAEQIPGDVLGRIMFEQVLRIWRESRTLDDIRSELETAIEHLDPDEDFTFMRP
ncbi:MAG: hypothetical protein Q7S99_15465 [Parvibaculum sp.]|nr:hypothetical protein [Parvibaculum sp.]|tara:strand:+ start:6644 stop:6862 length:219 start_codon:yes stop_codon:yes gene_type:complete